MSIMIAALRHSVLPSLMAACALLGGLGPLEAFAQAAFKPSGTVKIVVMFPPGGRHGCGGAYRGRKAH
ncbi:MAG: hypothetical protein HQ450_02510 [Alcaligenaceae bacterium]|nr:hypothetical protein [Alcaligenaceae bacterium]